MNILETFYLRSVFNKVIRLFNLNEECTPLSCRRFRNILIKASSGKPINKGLLKCRVLANAVQTDIMRDCNYNSLFGISKLSHNLSSFIFNFTSHTLYDNTMISYIVQNCELSCRQCDSMGNSQHKRNYYTHFLGMPMCSKNVEQFKGNYFQ